MKVVIVDFYDSFTYNLFHYFDQLNVELTVIRHDYLNFNDLDRADAIVLSPGPGLPREKVNLMEILELYAGKKPILGICLGMQAIGLHLGASLVNQNVVKHGVQEKLIVMKSSVLFNGLPNEFMVGLYHSWKVEGIQGEWKTAELENQTAMSIEVPNTKLFGVQFHPESVLTQNGLKILANFLKFVCP